MCFSSLPAGLGFLGCSDLCYTTLHGSGLSLCVAVCTFQDLHGGCFSGWKDILQLTCTRKPRLCPACRYSCWHIRMLMDSHAGIEFSFCDLRGAWGVGVMGWWPVARSLWLLTAAHWFQLSMSSTWLGPGVQLAIPVPCSGRCVESCMSKRERQEGTSGREPPAPLLV